MILDERTYTLHAGKLAEFLAAYEKEGYPIQTKHLGKPFGYFITEVGTINQIVHMWAYEDMGDREQRRAALKSDPRWVKYSASVRQYIISQENKILIPAAFSP